MIKKYLKHNILFVIPIIFFSLSIVLKSMGIVDITIPCLFKTIFNISCPGCGITSSLVHISKLEFKEAFDHKPIVFLLIPIFILFLYKDYKKYILK